MANGRTAKAYSALAVGVISIAWSAIFVRWTHMPGIASAFYRVLFASIALWPFLLLSGTKLPRVRLSSYGLAALGGAFFAGDVGLYNIAVLHTSVGSASFLSNSAPLLVGLLTWGITRRLPSRHFWMALAIALAGAFLIVVADARVLGSRPLADLAAVLSSICFALYLLATERLRESFNTLALLALSTTASAAVLLVFAAMARISLAVPNLSSLAALAGLALVCQLAGYFCLTYALGHLPATVTSLILLASAPLTAVFALLIFAERMTIIQVLGGGLVLLGVWIITGADRNRSSLPCAE
jgi:drug/metabolite transporter (DMT)-like permease